MLIQEYKYLSSFFGKNDETEEFCDINILSNYSANNLIRIIATKYAEFLFNKKLSFNNFESHINIAKNNIEQYFIKNIEEITNSNKNYNFLYTLYENKIPEFKIVEYESPKSSNEFIILNLERFISPYSNENNVILSNCVKLFLTKTIPYILQNDLYDLEIDNQGYSWPIFYLEDTIFDKLNEIEDIEDIEEKLISIFNSYNNENLFIELYIPEDKNEEIKCIIKNKTSFNYGLNRIKEDGFYNVIVFSVKE